MNIQIKNIRVYDKLSEETTCFTAELYINGIKAAECKNNGRGGAHDYSPYLLENRILITAAQEYCKTLPPVIITMPGHVTTLPNSLELFIDDLLFKFLNDKDTQKLQRQLLRDMAQGILVGTEQSYTVYYLRKPLVDIIKYHGQAEKVINDAITGILPKMKPGERILNTNFPEGVIIPEPVNA